MTKIVNEINRGDPVLKDSIPLNIVKEINEVTKFDDETYIGGIIVDKMNNMGGLSQVEFYSSQYKTYRNIDIGLYSPDKCRIVEPC